MPRSAFRTIPLLLALLLVGPPAAGPAAGREQARPGERALPTGFVDQVMFSGLTRPTKLVFSPDGRVFVAEKSGIVKVFSGLSDPTPTVFADLRDRVYDFAELGLLGLALAPGFPADPYVYVGYTYDGRIGGGAPTYHDTCPAVMSCLTSARVSRLRAAGDVATGGEQVLVHDWCQQSDTHTIGDLGFGPDGALYVAAGEGATDVVDYGQFGDPANPCGDPPAPVGGTMTPPTAQGGALRAQDVRTAVDPTGLSGTLIRIDPATGRAMPDNPLAASPDPNTRRIVAYGFRNPYRWTFRPGTDEVWIADVGFRTWEEIDRVTGPAAGPVRDHGWPCYEGPVAQPDWRATHLALCDSLYAAPAGTVTAPHYAYTHAQPVVEGDGCRTGVGSITGVAFYPRTGGNYPARYFGALFFVDFLRGCVWGMKPGSGGVPNVRYIQPLGTTVGRPVDLEIGPDRNLWYVDISGGVVRRFKYK